jgi:hypothetical protein
LNAAAATKVPLFQSDTRRFNPTMKHAKEFAPAKGEGSVSNRSGIEFHAKIKKPALAGSFLPA